VDLSTSKKKAGKKAARRNSKPDDEPGEKVAKNLTENRERGLMTGAWGEREGKREKRNMDELQHLHAARKGAGRVSVFVAIKKIFPPEHTSLEAGVKAPHIQQNGRWRTFLGDGDERERSGTEGTR